MPVDSCHLRVPTKGQADRMRCPGQDGSDLGRSLPVRLNIKLKVLAYETAQFSHVRCKRRCPSRKSPQLARNVRWTNGATEGKTPPASADKTCSFLSCYAYPLCLRRGVIVSSTPACFGLAMWHTVTRRVPRFGPSAEIFHAPSSAATYGLSGVGVGGDPSRPRYCWFLEHVGAIAVAMKLGSLLLSHALLSPRGHVRGQKAR